MVEMNIRGQTMKFMDRKSPLSELPGTIPADHSAAPTDLGGHQVVHEFLYLPDFPVPLCRGKKTSQSKDSPLEPELEKKFPLVWAEGNPPGLAKNHAPILIDLKPGAQPVKLHEDPIPSNACLGTQGHLERLLQ
ncbi:LOW QUALITY PROTEIN: hypothetical protein QTO34_014245 [Cnephaeus nilssonii]|uniref:Uncharacterized protein n=1 Tax=Cnephaeus nilssonii TaxID=3371016 RepID=A0AA40I730_CNENI|nr:LOW QUALITY PROTEIN: hypothetical protein QTO34_014245 [Eptesicus nilssonii]